MKTELTLLITDIQISITRGECSARRKFRAANFYPQGKISTQENYRPQSLLRQY